LICGHSNCGGCNAFYMDKNSAAHIPHTTKWLELAKDVRIKMDNLGIKNLSIREWMTEQLNIVEQMNHLLSYPYIEEKFNSGELDIFGWYYIIETGEVFNYDKTLKKFVKIE